MHKAAFSVMMHDTVHKSGACQGNFDNVKPLKRERTNRMVSS